MRRRPSGFGTVTIGAAYSLSVTFLRMPSLSNRSSSLPTTSRIAKGTCLALKNLGVAPSYTCNVAVWDRIRPLILENSLMLFKNGLKATGGMYRSYLMPIGVDIFDPVPPVQARAVPFHDYIYSRTNFCFCPS